MRAAPGHPQQPRHDEAEGGKKGEKRRQADDAERQSPGKFGIDEERRAEPPEPGEKVAEAQPPARAKGEPERAGADPARLAGGRSLARPIEQPHRHRHRYDQRRPDIDRRHSQRAESAREQRDEAPRPPARQDYSIGQALHRRVPMAGRRPLKASA